MLQQDTPVAHGAAIPLVQTPNDVSAHVHGTEGFGDMPPKTPKGQAVELPAHEYLCKLINENAGEIILCPVGPLTNIALALRHDPSIAQKVKSIVVMGGALHISGNVTPYAEANIWNDPHAADEVFAADWEVTMIGLDVTKQVVCPHADFEALKSDVPIIGKFLSEATDFYINFYKNVVGIEGCQMHDPITVLACIYPELFTYEYQPLEVSVASETVGQTIISEDANRRAAKVAVGVDVAAVKAEFFRTIKTGY